MSHADRLTGEFDFIAWVRKQTAVDPRVPIGIGDDTASLRLTPGREVLVTTDMILEGVHFDLTRSTTRLVGRKAMGVNLSDIAAMAGIPVAAVVSVGLPRDISRRNAEELFCGIHELASEFNVALVGGDTNSSRSGLVICITLIGESTDHGPVRRSGARAGDWILVTGSFGGSILGKHLDFKPRVREALTLHERFPLHAMIDVSDGLGADLGHILEESRCGAVLQAAAIPISDAARQISDERSSLDRALQDGEDFELLFTLAPDDARRLMAEQPLAIPVSHIGEITAQLGLWLLDEQETRRAIEAKGFDHFRSDLRPPVPAPPEP